MSTHTFRPGDVAMVTDRSGKSRLAIHRDAEPVWFTGQMPFTWFGSAAVTARPLVVIDPEDREQAAQVLGAYSSKVQAPYRGEGEPDDWRTDRMQAALRSLLAPPKPDAPIVHAVMYRNHHMGTLCNSGAWGTPELFTAVTESVTCPGCRSKLGGPS